VISVHAQSVAGACVALLLVLHRPLHAQAAPRDTARLADLVVTATRTPTSLPVPAATTVILGDDLRARGIHLLQDALREVPGVALVQGGSYGAVTSLFLRGGESDYVKVLLDGVPLNSPGGSLNLSDLTTDDLDRIEVVRGPVSVLYGADAMSGVIQLFTRRGGRRPSGALATRAGTFGSSTTEARMATGSAAGSVSLAASRFASDGIYDFNSRYVNRVGSARLETGDDEKGRLTLTARGGDVVAGYPTDFAGVPTDRNQRTTERRLTLGLAGTRPLSRSVTGTVQGFASRLNAGATNRSDTPADTLGYGFDSDRAAVTWRRGAEGRVDWRRGPTTTLSFGGGVERETIASTGRVAQNYGTGRFEESSVFDQARTTRHFSGQVIAAPTAAITLQLGARLDDNSAFGQFATWRAGASARLAPSTRLWGAIGTAFKAPTFSELYASDPFEVGNAALLPERSRNVELAVAQTLAAGATFEVTAFDQRFLDLIQYVGAAPGQPTYVNLGEASSRGVETSLTARPAERVSVRARWTWLQTEVRDSGSASSLTFQQGSALLRRPARSGGVTATLHGASSTLAVAVNHVGERDDVDYRDFPATRTALPSYTTVDLSLGFPVRRGGVGAPSLDLTLRGENLFDTAFDQVVGFPGRGRTLFVGAALRY
jgi:vitamin B12 transporter